MEYGIVAPICKLAFLAHGRTATASGCFPGSRFDPRAAAAAIVVPAAPSASRHRRSDRWAGASQPIGRRPHGRATGKLDDSWQEPTALIAALQELAPHGMAGQWASQVLRQIDTLRASMADDPAHAAAILGQLGGEANETLALAARDGRQGACPTTPQDRAAPGASGGRLAARCCSRGPGAADGADDAAGPERANGLPGRRGCRDGQLARRAGLAGVPVHRRAAPLCLAHAAARRSGAAAHGAARAFAADANALDRGAAAVRLFRTAGRAARALWPWAAQPDRRGRLVGRHRALRNDRAAQRRPPAGRRLPVPDGFVRRGPARAAACKFDSIYRNANVRIAVSERLLNDLMPPREPEYQRFTETVLGHPVQGVSLAKSQTAVRMLPDPNQALLALQVTGKIVASSTSQAGPARFRNDSESTYVGTKKIQIDMKGVTIYPVEVGVNNDTQLRGINTSWIGIPICGEVVRKIVERQYDQNKEAASHEMEQKLAARIRERVDAEAREKLSGVVERLNQRVFDPLNTLLLDPQLISAQTTATRFWMRLRLAGDNHLGSHTPRPQAPADSLASVQLHESVFANGIERMQLAGRTFTMPALSQHVAQCLNCPSPWAVDPDNADVKITFAKQDPIVVHCRDGQVVVTVSFARLSKASAGRKWSNFQVRAFYRPRANGRSVELVRDGVIHFPSGGAQLALRGAFSRVFSKDAAWQLVPRQIIDDPRLGDTAITQLVVDDGWIGIALGPKPPVTASRRRLVSRQ